MSLVKISLLNDASLVITELDSSDLW